MSLAARHDEKSRVAQRSLGRDCDELMDAEIGKSNEKLCQELFLWDFFESSDFLLGRKIFRHS